MTTRHDTPLPEEARKAVAAMWKRQTDSRTPEQDEKTEILRSLDQQIAELTRQLDALRIASRSDSNPELAALEQNSSRLLALRQSVEGAHTGAVLAQLKPQVVEALRGAGEATQAGSASVAGAAQSAAFSARQLAQAEFHARMTTIEREIAPIYQRMDQARASDDRLAARYGVNVTPWNSFDDAMKASAADKRKNGDRVGALEDDLLRSAGAVQRSQALIDAMPEGEEKQRKQAEQQKQVEDAQKMMEAVRKAHEAQVEQRAAERVSKGESPEAAAEWAKAELKHRMDKVGDRLKTVPESKGLTNTELHSKIAGRDQAWSKGSTQALDGERRDGLSDNPAPAYQRAQDVEKTRQAQASRDMATAKGMKEDLGGIDIAGLSADVKNQIERAKPETKVAAADTGGKPETPASTPKTGDTGKAAGAAKA